MFKNFLAVALLVFGVGACAQSGEGTNLDPEQAAEKIAQSEVVVLDVRTPGEYKQGHIENARLIDFYGANFEEEISKLPKDQEYVVYCRSGGRSGKSVNMMKKMGFEKVYNLSGGAIAWQRAQLDLVK
jgi:rhodanese-related sulfurtransferase